MGFDAGSIRATLELDSEQFDEDLDKAQERAAAFEKETVKVPLNLETEEFDAEADEVDERKDRLEEPILISAEIDNAELAASAAEAEAIVEALKESTADEGGTGGLLSLNPANLEEEGRQVRALITDIASSAAEATGGEGLVAMMLGSGATQSEAISGLKSLGFGSGEAKDMISAYTLAQKLLPPPGALSAAIQDELEPELQNALYQLSYSLADWKFGGASAGGMLGQGTGGGSLLPFLGGSGAGSNIIDAEWWDTPAGRALDGQGNQAALPPAQLAAMLGRGPVAGYGDEFAGLANNPVGTSGGVGGAYSGLVNSLMKAGVGADELQSTLKDMGFTESEAKKAVGDFYNGMYAAAGMVSLIDVGGLELGIEDATEGANAAARYLKKIAADADKGDGGFLSALSGFFGSKGAGGKLTGGIDGLANGIPGISGGLPGLATATPIAGALGLGLGGAVAGTAIGSAGALWALVPGLIDLMHGYTAYQAQQTAKTTPNAANYATAKAAGAGGAGAIGGALGGLIGGGGSLLGGLEGQINPQIVTFINSLATAMKSVGPFAQTAVTVMGGFFGVIDRGLSSGGFKSFMSTMTSDVGPIMVDFGTTIINLGKAFGDFLKIFGGAPAQMVGQWFASETSKLDTFLSHAKISPGFMAGAHEVFHILGLAIDTAWDAAKKLLQALAPIGLFFLKTAGPVLQFTDHLVKMIPAPLLTALIGAALGFKALGIAVSIATAAMDVDPIFLIITALALLGLGAYELATHWHQVWTDIKNWFDDAVTFLRSGFGTLLLLPLGLVGVMIILALHWQQVWADMQTAFHVFMSDVADPLVNFFTESVPHAWDVFTSAANNAWQTVDNNVFHPIASFFNTVLSGALSGATTAWNIMWNGLSGVVKTVWGILKPIFDAISKAIGDITGPLNTVIGLASKAGSGAVSALTGSAHLGPIPYALGGGFSGNSPIMVGENGPELIFPKSAGYVVPNNRLNVGGGSNSGLTLYVDARGSTDANAVRSSVQSGVNSSLPKLRAALERGSGSMVPV